jgi:hypothetical protein
MKWQDIKDGTAYFFKKVSRSRTIWIGGGASIFGVFAMIALLTGVTIDTSGDIFCESACNISVNITSTYWEIKFSDDFNLVYFDKDVTYKVYVPTYGNRWRPFDYTKDYIKRKNKVNYLPNRFLIEVYKAPEETVKYGVKAMLEDVDPYLIGFKNCQDTIFYKNYTEFICLKNKTTENGTVACVEWKKNIIETNYTECIYDGIVRVGNYNVSYPNYYCNYVGNNRVDCVELNDGANLINPSKTFCQTEGGMTCIIHEFQDTKKYNISIVNSEKYEKGKTKVIEKELSIVK